MSTPEPSDPAPEPPSPTPATGSSAAEPDGSRVRSRGRRRRWPLSPLNTTLVAVCLVGALIALVAGRGLIALPLALAAVLGGGGAMLARRAGAGDLERVNALEYADERDRAAGVKGLAAVGAAALVLVMLQVVVSALAPGAISAATWGVVLLLALSAVWFVANWYFVRRG